MTTGDQQGQVRLWRTATGTLVTTLDIHDHPILSLALRQSLVSIDEAGWVSSTRLADSALEWTYGLGSQLVTACLTPDGRSFFAANGSVADLEAAALPTGGVATVEDSLARTDAVQLWRLDSGIWRGTNQIHGTYVNRETNLIQSLYWRPLLPDGWTLLKASGEGKPRVSVGQIIFDAPQDLSDIEFSYDVRVLAGQEGRDEVGSSRPPWTLVCGAPPPPTGLTAPAPPTCRRPCLTRPARAFSACVTISERRISGGSHRGDEWADRVSDAGCGAMARATRQVENALGHRRTRIDRAGTRDLPCPAPQTGLAPAS